MSEPMTDEELTEIEARIDAPTERRLPPRMTDVRRLLAEVLRLRAELQLWIDAEPQIRDGKA